MDRWKILFLGDEVAIYIYIQRERQRQRQRQRQREETREIKGAINKRRVEIKQKLNGMTIM